MSKGKLRNKPCHCGSGRKYKHCHMNNDGRELNRAQRGQIEELFKKSFDKKDCLAPESMRDECEGPIVNAHVVSKSANLKAIARKGHVYTLKPSIGALQKHGGNPPLELVGINKATTFTGFCAHHDRTLFSDIENSVFEGTPKQVFLLGYRTISRELFMKRSSSKSNDGLLGLGRANADPVFKAMLEVFNTGTKQAIKDLENQREGYESDLANGSFDNYWSIICRLSGPLPVVCSGALLPHFDFAGTQLQDLADLTIEPEEVTFASVIAGDTGYVTLSGRKGPNNVAFDFIKSFCDLAQTDMIEAFITLSCLHCETTCFAPEWWEGLSSAEQERIRSNLSVGANFASGADSDSLKPVKPYSITQTVVSVSHNL